MKVLWEQSPLSAQQIIDALEGQVDWNPRTIKTLLNRLIRKGALGFNRTGRFYLYYPCVDEKDLKRQETRSFVNRVFDGALKPMLAAFLEDGKLTSEELNALRKVLNNQKEDGHGLFKKR